MKIILPLFATLVSIVQISSGLPVGRPKLDLAALAKARFVLPVASPANLVMPRDANDIGVRAETDDPSAAGPVETTPTADPLVNTISESMASVLKPLEDVASLNGLKLKTTLELEKQKTNSADVVPGKENSLKGLKFKATVELEQEDGSNGGNGVNENETEVDEDEMDDDGDSEDSGNGGEDENEPDENENGNTGVNENVPNNNPV